MKYAIVLVALSLGACATPYERCSEITVNPYGIDLDDLVGSEARLQAAMKESKLTEEQFKARVRAQTKFEWHRYGSLDSCVASLAAQDAVTASQINGLIETAAAPRGQTVTQPVGFQPGYVAPKPVDFVLLRDCEDYCRRVADNLAACEAKCRQ